MKKNPKEVFHYSKAVFQYLTDTLNGQHFAIK